MRLNHNRMDTPIETSLQVIATSKPPQLRNPEGKGGFREHPENINPGGWKKEHSISYQYNLLMRMTVTEIKGWLKKNPEDTRTMAQQIAFEAILRARKDYKYLTEITDRTEGKARQILALEDTREVEEIKDRLKEILYGKPEKSTTDAT